MAVYANIFVDQGAKYSSAIDVVSANGAPLNLTTYTITGKIRKSYHSTTSVDFGIDVYDAPNGKIQIYLEPSKTALLKAGRYVYDIQVASNLDSNDVLRIVEGQVEVNPRVTRPDTSEPEPPPPDDLGTWVPA